MRLLAPSLLALASPCLAQAVYVVDDTPGPGVDFAVIQEAIDAAAPGDRIEVMPGDYFTFAMEKGVTVMGRPGVRVASAPVFDRMAAVRALPAGQVAVLSDIEIAVGIELVVENCAGTVIVDGVSCHWNARVLDSDDVRFQSSTFPATLEVVRSTLNLLSSSTNRVELKNESRGAIADCTMLGSNGSDGNSCWILGGVPTPGSNALEVTGDSQAWVSRSRLRGGHGGYDTCGPFDGPPGATAVVGSGARLTLSQCSLEQSPHFILPSIVQPIVSPGGVLDNVDDFPAVTLGGGSAVGDTAFFQCYAGAGTSVRLWAGRTPRTELLAPGILPRFHSSERGVSLGAFPASEERVLPFVVPPLLRGTLIHLQVWRTRTDGSTELSNGATLVVR